MTARQEFATNIRASIGISLLGIGGKALAVFKTVIIAAMFGVSGSLDAFWVAFLIPNILPVFVRGAFVTSFVPFFMRHRPTRGEDELWRAANILFTAVLALSLAVTAVVFIWPMPMVEFVAPGLPSETARIAAELLQITIFSLLLLVATAMLTAISNCRQRFFAASLESLSTNILVIGCIYAFSGAGGIYALAYGTVAGFALQFLIMVYSCRGELVQYLRPAWGPGEPLFREYLGGVGPVLVGALSGVGMGIVTQVFMSYLGKGSISILQYAAMISMLPIEIFASSIQTTFFPTIAKYSTGNPKTVADAHRTAVGVLLFVLVPVSAIFMALDEPIVRILLGYGKFSDPDIHSTAVVLTCLSIGMIGRAIAYFNFQVLHALGRPWSQVKIGLLQLVMNALFSWILMKPFGVVGIAVASSLSLTISMLVSYRVLARMLGPEVLDGVIPNYARYVSMGLIVYALLWALMHFAASERLVISRLAYTAEILAFIGVVMIPYLLISRIAGLQEAIWATSKIRRVLNLLTGVKNV